MKRLVAYIYGYKNGIKGRNAGFGKIDTNGDDMKLNITLRCSSKEECLKVYFFVREEDKTYTIGIGDMVRKNMECELKGNANIKALSKGKYSTGDIYGILIKASEDVKYISFWKEEYTLSIVEDLENASNNEKGTKVSSVAISEYKEIEVEEEDTIYLVDPDCTPVNDEVVAKHIEENIEKMDSVNYPTISTFIKNRTIKPIAIKDRTCNMCEIEPRDIYEFPRECWCTGKNAYTCHGFIKYGKLYVIEWEGLYLAVPGYNSTNEKIMASRYGFDTFVENDTECLRASSCGRWLRGYWCKKIL